MNSRWTAGTMFSGLGFGVVVFMTGWVHSVPAEAAGSNRTGFENNWGRLPGAGNRGGGRISERRSRPYPRRFPNPSSFAKALDRFRIEVRRLFLRVVALILVALFVQLFLLSLELFDLTTQLLPFAFQDFKLPAQLVELLLGTLVEITIGPALMVSSRGFFRIHGSWFGQVSSTCRFALCLFLDPFHFPCVHPVLPLHFGQMPGMGFDLRDFFSVNRADHIRRRFHGVRVWGCVPAGHEGLDHFLQSFQPGLKRRIARFGAGGPRRPTRPRFRRRRGARDESSLCGV